MLKKISFVLVGLCFIGVVCTIAFAWFSPSPFNCKDNNHCDLLSEKEYKTQIIGRLVGMADQTTSQRVFDFLRAQGWWTFLPAAPEKFYRSVGMVALQVEGQNGRLFTVMMPAAEREAAAYAVGDLVRYSPHIQQYERPPENTPEAHAYWSVTGCVLILCRAQDALCMDNYQQGFFDFKTGQEVNKEGVVIQGGKVIDTVTMLPK